MVKLELKRSVEINYKGNGVLEDAARFGELAKVVNQRGEPMYVSAQDSCDGSDPTGSRVTPRSLVGSTGSSNPPWDAQAHAKPPALC